ncbi:unnamed protein product [Phytophthora lilii]|uniref:Unnamed protein product n=1 Tax=Phytophthora lilii TaxID=2077276 RepID=A0A9W6X3Z7_9STRA|nr:unnamed protein product [Phytophthora lilii]
MKGRIYQILNNDASIIYVGSTTNSLTKCWKDHLYGAKGQLNGKYRNLAIYQHFHELGVDQFKIELIKEYDVVDIKHLRAIEQLWINKVRCINKQPCFMPISKKARDKLYGDAHRAELNAKSMERYFANHEANLVARKEYRAAHREQINAKKGDKIACECGVSYTRSHKARHISTARHQASLQSV